jgi:hypothetical protein
MYTTVNSYPIPGHSITKEAYGFIESWKPTFFLSSTEIKKSEKQEKANSLFSVKKGLSLAILKTLQKDVSKSYKHAINNWESASVDYGKHLDFASDVIGTLKSVSQFADQYPNQADHHELFTEVMSTIDAYEAYYDLLLLKYSLKKAEEDISKGNYYIFDCTI